MTWTNQPGDLRGVRWVVLATKIHQTPGHVRARTTGRGLVMPDDLPGTHPPMSGVT